MANPSAADIDAALTLLGGRVSVMSNEVLRLLHDNLPDTITRQNNAKSIAIPEPTGWRMAPETLDEQYVGNILVGKTVQLVNEGPRVFKKVLTVTVMWILGRAEVREQVDDADDGADLITAVLYPCLNGWQDPSGRWAWRLMKPTTQVSVPGNWEHYYGIAVGYEVQMMPGDNSWS